jgi:hypothetical protein
MPITDRSIIKIPGTRLKATYKGIEYSAVVLENGNINIDSDFAQQVEFKSLSAAGSAIMGGIACNGWRFWSVEGQESTTATPTKADTPKKGKGSAGSRTKSKKAAPEAATPTDKPIIPEGADYLIDSDGRPIYEGETPAAVEAEARL